MMISLTKAQLQSFEEEEEEPQVLLLAPTRELAAQIHREASILSGGMGLKVQLLTKARAQTSGALNAAR